MKRFIREYTPFVMLGYSLMFSVFSYFEFYADWFVYLPNLVGFSVVTSIFMLTVYMNRSYCTTTKIAVWSLLVLSINTAVLQYLDIYNDVYDIVIILIVFMILLSRRLNNSSNEYIKRS